MRQHADWRWHLDWAYVRINGEMLYLWRAVDHEGKMLELLVTEERDKAAALKFIKKAMKRQLQEDEGTPDLRLGARDGAQPLRSEAPSHQPTDLQGETLSCIG